MGTRVDLHNNCLVTQLSMVRSEVPSTGSLTCIPMGRMTPKLGGMCKECCASTSFSANDERSWYLRKPRKECLQAGYNFFRCVEQRGRIQREERFEDGRESDIHPRHSQDTEKGRMSWFFLDSMVTGTVWPQACCTKASASRNVMGGR